MVLIEIKSIIISID